MEEMPEHVIMGCQFAKDFWQRIGLTPLLSSSGLNDFHNVQCPSNIPQKHFAKPSSLSIAGSFGSAGMESYSDQKEQGINKCWQLASLTPNSGNPGCLRKTGS